MNERSDRLDSWKEIAEYVDREVRTVIRWEKERGLPVHRLPGDKRSAIYAFRSEIDRWMESQASLERNGKAGEWAVEPESAVSTAGQPLPGQTHADRWTARPFPTLALAIGAVLLVGVAAYALRPGRAHSAGPAPLQSPLTFARSDFPALTPADVASADFSGDGRPDLVFTNRSNDSVTVLLNEGKGAFPGRVDSPGVSQPERLAVGDFNGDGILDIAVTGYKGPKMHVLLGDGRGGFRPHFEFDVGGRARWIAAGDLNRDGLPDLAISAAVARRVYVLLGKRDGTFSPSAVLETGVEPAAVVLADLNRDEIPDIAVTEYHSANASSISIFVANGDGTFRPRLQLATGINGPLGMATADVNGDQRPDLVSANFPDKASLLLAKPDGAGFQPPVLLDAGRGNGFVAVADLDRDGAVDLLVLGEHSDSVSVLRGRGDGTFAPKQDVPTGRYPDGLVVADFDGDGKLDFAVSNLFGKSVSVYLNTTAAAVPPRWFSGFGARR